MSQQYSNKLDRRHGQGGIATDAMEKAEQAQEEVLEAVPWKLSWGHLKHIMGKMEHKGT